MKRIVLFLTLLLVVGASSTAFAEVSLEKTKTGSKRDLWIFSLDKKQTGALYRALDLEVLSETSMFAVTAYKRIGSRLDHSEKTLSYRLDVGTTDSPGGTPKSFGNIYVYLGPKQHDVSLYYHKKTKRYELHINNRPHTTSKGKKTCLTHSKTDPCKVASRLYDAMKVKPKKEKQKNGTYKLTKTLELEPEEKDARSSFLVCKTSENAKGNRLASSEANFVEWGRCYFLIPKSGTKEPTKTSSGNSVEKYRKGCAKGDMGDCASLGWHYRWGKKGIKRNDKRALALFEKACKGGDDYGCYYLGEMYEFGVHVSKSYKKAAELYKKSCDTKAGPGCSSLGALYQRGKGVNRSGKRAGELYAKACSASVGSACNSLGVLYALGEGVKKSHKRAASFYEKACKLSDKHGCFNLATALYAGTGTSKDHKRAAKLFVENCERGHAESCNWAGALYRQGHGVSKDHKRAAKLYKTGCDKGSMSACLSLGHVYVQGEGVSKDEKRGATFFKEACDGGLVTACTALAGAYSEGIGVSEDLARAEKIYKKTCDGGDNIGCNGFAWVRCHDRGKCDATAEKYARKAVEADPENAMIIDTLAYIRCQRGDAKEGNALYDKACKIAPEDKSDYCSKSCKK